MGEVGMVEIVAAALAQSFRDTVAMVSGDSWEKTGVTLPSKEVWERYARAAIEAMPQMGWQPIATAPKTGRIIGVWKDGKWQAAELWWDDMVEEWVHTSADYYCKPTHWMLAPAITSDAGGKE